MTKNQIIQTLVDDLLKQRSMLGIALAEMNYNEPTANEKRMAIEAAIRDIDLQLDKRVMDCELTPIINPKN